MEQKYEKKIPKWFLLISILGLFVVITLFLWLLLLVYTNLDSLQYISNSCEICQRNNFEINLTELLNPINSTN